MKNLLLTIFLFSASAFADDSFQVAVEADALNTSHSTSVFTISFQEAVEANDLSAAQTLLEEGADPNEFVGFWDEPAMKIAIENKSLEMIKLLLRHKADPNHFRVFPPLRIAIEENCFDCVELLVEAGAYVHYYWLRLFFIRENYLTLAEREEQWKIAEYLRELGLKRP